MSTTATTGPKFEQRHYEAIRRERLALVVGRVGIEGAQSPELQRLKKRRKTELQSTLAEGIKPEQVRSVIDTHYTIEMEAGKLVAEDGEPIEGMLQRALKEDRILATQDEFFEPFLVQQTQSDIDELHEWEAMARGETAYNTAITFSGYKEEYDDGTAESHDKLKRAGQKPYWRRGMFRVAHARDGEVHIFNYSIDNCSVELMSEAARQELDYEFKADNSTDMQAERIHLQIEDDSWRSVASRLLSRGDKFLGEKHGGVWKHGYNPNQGVRRAQAFVESQTQIVDSLINIDEQLARKHSTFEDYSAEFELKLYDCFALLEKRLDLGREDEPIVDYEAASGGAGDIARAEGKSYDACGLVIDPNNVNQATTGQKTGFESLKRLENKKISCRACKKDVVVPKRDLDEGKLTCSQCGYWLDVCTGKSGTNKSIAEKIKAKTVSGFELITGWLRRDKHERQIKKTAERQAKAELGDKVRGLDIKRREKRIRQKLENRQPRS